MSSFRRSFLGLVTAGGVSATAGCLDYIVDDFDDEPEMPVYMDWLPATVIEEDFGLDVLDYQEVREWAGEENGETDENEPIAEEDIDYWVTIGVPDGSYTIMFGTIEPEEAAEGLEFEDPEREYEGFDVYGEETMMGERYAAISEEVLIIGGEEYQTFIDAGLGETDRLVDMNETWVDLLTTYSNSGRAVFGTQGSEMIESEENDVEAFGMGMDIVGDDLEGEGEYHFVDVEAAEGGTTELEETFDTGELDGTVEQDGSVVYIEFVNEDVEL